MTSDFLLWISNGWVVTFQDSHRMVFTFRSRLDLLGVVLAFWISILKISKLLQNCWHRVIDTTSFEKTFEKFFFLFCCGCDTHYIVSVHIQSLASIYTLSLCRGHSWRMRLAKQETLTLSGHLVSPLVCRGPWMSTVVLYCWCHSDGASVLFYFTVRTYSEFLSKVGDISFQEYVSKGISHPVFYGDLVYKLRRVKDTPNFISSGSKIFKRLRRRQFNPLTIERTIGLMLGPSTALYRPFLKHCTLPNKAVGTI